ncbi:MAG: tetraacyldisaccharide 4'-kinase, partial [Shewanella sp.]
MQALVNKIWYQGHPLRWLLLPFSGLFALVTALRRGLFRFGIKAQTTLPVPVIVVGNITVGGSGKTPT